MRNEFKKVGLLCLVLLVAFIISPLVKASEQNCSEHTNYYFLLYIGEEEEATNLGENNFSKTHHTFFNKLPKNATIVEEGQVCIKTNKDDTVHCATGNELETWTLEDYYTKYKESDQASGKDLNAVKIIKVAGNDYGDSTFTEGDKSYITHVGFYTDDATNFLQSTDTTFTSAENFVINATGASVLPSTINEESQKITMETEDADIFTTIARNFPLGNSYTIWTVKWKDGEENKDSFLLPALYKITYKSCKYNATIDYFYEGGTKKVEFKDSSNNNPYVKEGLEDGTKYEVTSPEAKNSNCKPEEAKKLVEIDGKDYHEIVYYHCSEGSPKTGNAIIIVAWIVGICALGYAIYYLLKKKKTNE